MPIPQYPYSQRQYEPLRDNLFYIDFSGVSFFNNDAVSKLKYQARGTSLPEKTLNTLTDGFVNQQSNYGDMETQAGRTWTVTFREIYEDTNIRVILNQWYDTIFNKTTFTQGSKMEYAWDVYVQFAGLSKEIFKEYTLVRAFPNSIGETSLTYPTGGGSGNIMEFTTTFTFDYIIEPE